MKVMMYLKSLAIAFAATNLVISPLAVAAEAQKSNVEAVKSFLKTSGLSSKKKMTFGEVYRRIFPALTNDEIAFLQPMAVFFKNEQMPSFDPVPFTDSQKVQQVRLNVQMGAKTYSLETQGSGDKVKLKFNNYVFDYASFQNPRAVINAVNKEAGVTFGKSNAPGRSLKDVGILPTPQEWKAMNRQQRAQFLILARGLLDDTQRVLAAEAKKRAAVEMDSPSKYAMVFEFLIPTVAAEAVTLLIGKDCFVNGWPSKFGRPGEDCGSVQAGKMEYNFERYVSGDAATKKKITDAYMAAAGSCSGSSPVPCNPVAYGFEKPGQALCTPRVTSSENSCESKRPLRFGTDNELDDVKALLESHLQGINNDSSKSIKKMKKDGDKTVALVDEADYQDVFDHIKNLQSHVKHAIEICNQSGVTQIVKTNKGDKDIVERQKRDCEMMVARQRALQNLEVNPTPRPPPEKVAEDTVAREDGSVATPDCGDTQAPAPVEERKPEVLTQEPAPVVHRDPKPTGDRVQRQCKRVCWVPALWVTERKEEKKTEATKQSDPKCKNDGTVVGSVPAKDEETPKDEKGSLCYNDKDEFKDGCKAAVALGAFGLFAFLIHKSSKRKPITLPYDDPAAAPINPITGGGGGTTDPGPGIAPTPAKEGTSTTVSPAPTGTGSIRKVVPGTR